MVITNHAVEEKILLNKSIVLFDGVCNLCNNAVQFIIKHDSDGHFLFASLQSAIGQELLRKYQLPTQNFDTFILVEKKDCYDKSTAALRIAKKLQGFWKWSYVFMIVPKCIRDALYTRIAKNRYKWFGKKEQCWLPSVELKQRFL